MVCAINRARSNSRLLCDRCGGRPSTGRPGHRAMPIAVTYAAIAAFWILMSDGLLQWAFGDMPPIPFIQPLKGLAFILVTSFLLHRLVRRIGEAARAEAVLRQDQQRLLVMLENMP